MSRRGLRRVLLQIGLGYTRSLRRLATVVVLAALTVAVSAAVVFPLWYFSTHDRPGYTLAVIAIAAAAVLYLIVRKSWAFWSLAPVERVQRVRRFFVRLLAVLGYLVGLYVILGLYVVGLLPAAVPLSVVYLFGLGYTLYARRSRARR